MKINLGTALHASNGLSLYIVPETDDDKEQAISSAWNLSRVIHVREVPDD